MPRFMVVYEYTDGNETKRRSRRVEAADSIDAGRLAVQQDQMQGQARVISVREIGPTPDTRKYHGQEQKRIERRQGDDTSAQGRPWRNE